MRRRRAGQRGIALIAVLWVTLLLGLIAATFLRETRVEVNLARNALADARAEALADAGIHWAMLHLLTADEAAAIRPDGRPYTFTLDGGAVRVTVQDEGGKIDLNRVSEEVLRGLFVSAGTDDATATRLAAAVADFRDSDHEPRPDGAEDIDYVRSGRPTDAKDSPLTAIDELQQIMGMTPDLYARVESLITVHSPRRDVDPMTAPAEVLRALPYISEPQRQEILTARQAGAQHVAVTVAAITVAATTAEGDRFSRRAVVRRGSNPLQPFEILDWRRVWLTANAEMHVQNPMD